MKKTLLIVKYAQNQINFKNVWLDRNKITGNIVQIYTSGCYQIGFIFKNLQHWKLFLYSTSHTRTTNIDNTTQTAT